MGKKVRKVASFFLFVLLILSFVNGLTLAGTEEVEIEVFDQEGRSLDRDLDVIKEDLVITVYEYDWFGLKRNRVAEQKGGKFVDDIEVGKYEVEVTWKGDVLYKEDVRLDGYERIDMARLQPNKLINGVEKLIQRPLI